MPGGVRNVARLGSALLVGATASLGLMSCSAAPPLSASCDAAFRQLVEDIEVYYSTDPVGEYLLEHPSIDSDAEQAEYDAVVESYEAEYERITLPTLQACESAEEWITGAKQYPSAVGVRSAEFVNDQHRLFECSGREGDLPACD